MKIRSGLLVACIVVVPLVAMFSHRIPPDAREAVREFLRGGAGESRRPPAPLVVAPASPAVMPTVVMEAGPASAAPLQPASVQTAAAAASNAPEGRSPPVVAIASHVAIGTGAGSDGIEQLRSLGAVAIECRPLHGSGGHVASCRMPVDGAGQLERLFQATGVDADSAVDRLLHDVNQWRRGTGGGPPRTMRF